ncbi:MAG: hypothetical protein ABIJ92_00895 [Candidatus Aenigmatarchaeota archaeon]
MAMKKPGFKKPRKRKKYKPLLAGTIRIKARGLDTVIRTASTWKKIDREFTETMEVVKLFMFHSSYDFLIDKKDPTFLKGQLSPEGKCQGARINILPDGRKLDKAYSLFAEQLTVHDEESNDHWDVLYRNPGGTYSYVYTLEKKAEFTKKKYKSVEEFGKYYSKLEQNVLAALSDKEDAIAVPMYTLLKTHMRIGNEIYYKAHGHKGLTTLKKSDIKIDGKEVTFKYKAKDGVPRNITREFPGIYIERLYSMLQPLESSSFVFTSHTGHPLDDKHFKKAFKKYCGKEFYPHIVRSYYATKEAKQFLSTHTTATKKEIRELFTSIAADLGHKRFDKKEQTWKEGYNVTIHHYIQPEILARVQSLAK